MATEDKHYALPTNEAEKERLDTQQHLLKQLFGGKLIFPEISLITGDKILDSGTGSGAWLLDLVSSGELPSGAVAYGIDPYSRTVPKNPPEGIVFSKDSVTSLPKDWSDTFVLVHQRLLLGALLKDEWASAMNEIYRVLAPGGWIQLCEWNSWKAGPAVERHRLALQTLCDSMGYIFEPCKEIPSMLHLSGFTDIHTVEKHTTLAGGEGSQHRSNLMGVFRGLKPQVVSRGGLGSDEEFESLMAAVDDEMENTPDSDTSYTIFYAQKPYV